MAARVVVAPGRDASLAHASFSVRPLRPRFFVRRHHASLGGCADALVRSGRRECAAAPGCVQCRRLLLPWWLVRPRVHAALLLGLWLQAHQDRPGNRHCGARRGGGGEGGRGQGRGAEVAETRMEEARGRDFVCPPAAAIASAPFSKFLRVFQSVFSLACCHSLCPCTCVLAFPPTFGLFSSRAFRLFRLPPHSCSAFLLCCTLGRCGTRVSGGWPAFCPATFSR